ncbi:sugar nucleotide-binding protein [Sediminibacillus massiliensis]|uniref:sugar nucleotide-binding protein n=1 Tax=Sediminibacillus massiliensis TaxID=1926277 RepID=UPI0009885531|nr:sugar nucleotide-binding protein [Sediminibacillus massiliensis]
MKICVFGADGYLGSAIYKILKEKGNFHVSGTYYQEPVHGLEDLEELDINQPEAFSTYYKNHEPDVVIWSLMNTEEEDVLVNEGLTHLITHLSPETKLIYLSSDFVFSAGEGPYSEEDQPKQLSEDNPRSVYVNGKIKAEKIIQKEIGNYLILRMGPLYGENLLGINDERSSKLEESLSAGENVFKSDLLIRSFAHVQDIAKAVVELVPQDLSGIFHMGPDQHASYHSFYRKRAQELSLDPGMVKEQPPEETDPSLPINTSLETKKLNGVLDASFREL